MANVVRTVSCPACGRITFNVEFVRVDIDGEMVEVAVPNSGRCTREDCARHRIDS